MEPAIRAVAFLLVLLVVLAREHRVPAFPRPPRPGARALANLTLAFAGVAVSRLVAPASLAVVALYAQARGFGLLNVLEVPPIVAAPVIVLVLDCAVYWQHRATHQLPWLWRLHAVHHADPHVDVTTAVRFHPIEIGLSLLVKAAVVLAVGGPAWAVVAFEVLLAAAALFNHANTRFPREVERALRRVVVTPELHRVHHLLSPAGRDRNFGFSVTLWDRLFGTYREPERAGVAVDRYGLEGVTAEVARSVRSMLALSLRARS